MFFGILIGIIAIAVIAIIAFERSNDKKSLVNLNNLRDLTLSTLTINDDLNIKGTTDFLDSGYINTGLSINQGLSVYGQGDFYNGLSVSGATNLFAEVNLKDGVCIEGGLSVYGTTNFYNGVSVYGNTELYDELRVYQGVSFDGTLSVTGETTLNDQLVSSSILNAGNITNIGNIETLGLSVTGGISVEGESTFLESTRLQKISTVRLDDLTAASYPGVSDFGSGYDLQLSDSGKTFFVNQQLFNDVPNNIRFNLPEIAGGLSDTNQSLNYKFVWTTGMSSIDNKRFAIFSENTGGEFNKIRGNVNLNIVGTSTNYNLTGSVHPVALSQRNFSVSFGYIYEGSYLDFVSNGHDWYVKGDIGISTITSVSYTNLGLLNGIQDSGSVTYGFLT